MSEHKEEGMPVSSRIYECAFIFSEIVVIVLYATCSTYDSSLNTIDIRQETQLSLREKMQSYYPAWQDVHTMIYIGFGFLMVFLKTSSWTAVGFNFLLSAWAFQIAILMSAFWHILFSEELGWHKI